MSSGTLISRGSAMFLGLVLSVTGGNPRAVEGATSPPGDPCEVEATGDSLSLTEFWSQALSRDPLMRAASERTVGAAAASDGVRRERVPEFAFEGVGNHGQRLSPGEERVLGVGARGEARLVATWTLLSSDRSRRSTTAGHALTGARFQGEAVEADLRVLLAGLYIDAVEGEGVLRARERHLDELRALAALVRRRVDAGVDMAWEGFLMEEALARGERLLAEAERTTSALRVELSRRAGRCIQPMALSPDGDFPDGAVDDNPRLRELLQDAVIREGRAREIGDGGRLRLDVLGITGPTYSRAFDEDDRIRTEYLVGLAARWSPDFGGIRGRRADAEAAEARALSAEADAYRETLGREWDRLQGDLAFRRAERQALERERELAQRREAAAVARWREGVDRWSEVIQARERRLQVDESVVRSEGTLARTLLLLHDHSGQLDHLPSGLGHEE